MAVAAACCAVLTATVTATATAQPVTVTDDRGQTVTLSQPAQRIVSLLPSLTETVCVLEACARLVGIDKWSNWPSQLLSLPRLGGMDDVQLEALVRLKPDLVLASRAHRVLDRLQVLGINTVALDGQSHADVKRHLRTVAALLGTAAQGDAAWTRVEEQLAKASTRVQGQWQGRQAYVEISTSPHAAGAGSFIGETLVHMGLGSIAPASMGPFPQLSPEYILRAQPDVILAVAREAAAMPNRPGWRSLRALRDDKVCAFAPAQWDLIVRPGPRLGEAALVMAECLAGLKRP